MALLGTESTSTFWSNTGCVLHADLGETAQLVEQFGAEGATSAAVQSLILGRHYVTEFGGQNIQTNADEVLALFRLPSQAIEAACEIQRRTAKPSFGSPEFARFGIGLHYGPILWKTNDIFGEAANIASAIAKRAKPGMIVTTAETLQAMEGTATGLTSYPLGTWTTVGERADVVYEIIWNDANLIATQILSGVLNTAEESTAIQISFKGKLCAWKNLLEPFTIGRDEKSHIVLATGYGSRYHARIEYRQGAVFVVDSSRNGSYVTLPGETEVMLKNGEIEIQSVAVVSFGTPKASNPSELLRISLIG